MISDDWRLRVRNESVDGYLYRIVSKRMRNISNELPVDYLEGKAPEILTRSNSTSSSDIIRSENGK